jgi:DNA polymerase-3 subunit delta
MSKSTITFYLLHGEDEYSRRAFLSALREKMNDPTLLNTSILEAGQISARQILNTASSYPFLADKRLVIVNGFLELLGNRKSAQEELGILSEGLPHLPDFARLVFHESKLISEKHAIYKLAKDHPNGFEKTFIPPKDATSWIISQAEKTYGIKIDPKAAHALALVVNHDLRLADSELAKLAAYVNYQRPIQEADVAVMTPYVQEAVVFDMIDALAEGDGKKAMRLTRDLMAQGSEAIPLIAMINRQFRLLLLTREYLDGGGSSSGVAAALGVHPFVASKLAPQAKRFASLTDLEGIYRKLAELDFHIKTGKQKDYLGLELLITNLT